MSIVVKHVSTEKLYVLLGCGRSEFQSMQPGNFGGSLKPDIRQGADEVICVSDEEGKIHWFDSTEFVVISSNGQPISKVCTDSFGKKPRLFSGAVASINKLPQQKPDVEIVTGVEIVDPDDAIRFLDS